MPTPSTNWQAKGSRPMSESAESIQEQIVRLLSSSEFQQLDAYYNQTTLFHILQVERLENPHSSFLAWLLDPAQTHQMGDYALRLFLQSILIVSDHTGHHEALELFPEDLSQSIIAGAFKLQDVLVAREEPTDVIDGKQGRIDIYIECDIAETIDGTDDVLDWRRLFVAVENKVKSSEHSDQTARYWKEMNRRMQDYHDESSPSGGEGSESDRAVPAPIPLAVFLTPLPSKELLELEKPECSCHQFVQINYQYLSDYVLAPCLTRCSNEDAAMFIRQYARCLSIPSFSISAAEESPAGQRTSGEMIMANSPQERDLLDRFWNSHKRVILAVLEAQREKLTEEEKAIADKMRNSQVSQKDNTQYEFQGKTYGKGRLVLAVVSAFNDDNGCTFDELREAFPDELAGPYRKYGLIQSVDEARRIADASSKKRHFLAEDEVIVTADDRKAAVVREWGTRNISNFVDHARKLKFVIKEVG